jgi:S-adenosylmethionine:diacylglycerol 3-amino-3-carboxypropyl transferase
MTEEKILKAMKSLDLTREEAIEMLMEDEAVDKMSMKEVTNDLTDEQKKVIKDSTKTTSKKRGKVKRERKVDTEKKMLLEILADALLDEIEVKAEMENEVALHFTYNESAYDLKLIKHRPPKA